MIAAACQEPEPCNLMVRNTHIHTLDEANHVVEAMVIRDGCLLNLGTAKDLLEHYEARKPFSTTDKSYIYPDVNDAHFVG